MYTTPQLVTLTLSLMNISLSLTKSQNFLNAAILLFVHFVVCIVPHLDQKKKQVVPSPHPLFILNLTTATLFIIIFLTPNYRLQLIQYSLARTVSILQKLVTSLLSYSFSSLA